MTLKNRFFRKLIMSLLILFQTIQFSLKTFFCIFQDIFQDICLHQLKWTILHLMQQVFCYLLYIQSMRSM